MQQYEGKERTAYMSSGMDTVTSWKNYIFKTSEIFGLQAQMNFYLHFVPSFICDCHWPSTVSYSHWYVLQKGSGAGSFQTGLSDSVTTVNPDPVQLSEDRV